MSRNIPAALFVLSRSRSGSWGAKERRHQLCMEMEKVKASAFKEGGVSIEVGLKNWAYSWWCGLHC